ncbi:MAG: methyltransferase domain-containing protein [Candidatus Omnitrophota bacterium]|nr:methyltransferase domain-containing protein [Candidatus Omnitrophota bacterium]
MLNLTPEEIKKLVKDKYGEVAKNPCAVFNFPVGRAFALKVGYPKEALDKLPQSLYESFTGANNPQPFVELKEGEAVLDLGCGAGLDLYFYAKAASQRGSGLAFNIAKAAGEKGKVYGLDISEAMVEKARKNMELTGIKNVEVKAGHSDNLPFADNFFDLVASNGIYNLSPDKEAVMREVFRVLKTGGRTVFCEIVLKNALSEEERKNANDWFRCIGGALVEADFLALMEKVGFKNIEVISKCRNARTGHPSAICANIRAYR